jgi:hypothetical protein
MKHKTILTTLVLCGCLSATAQQAIVSSGNSSKSANGSVSFSIGQISYQSNLVMATNGTVSLGVQQPVITVVTSSANPEIQTKIDCKVFPNPTSDNLQLTINELPSETWSYALYNIKGTLLSKQTITNTATTIPMVNLEQSTYVLKVTDTKNDIITFKIIKK